MAKLNCLLVHTPQLCLNEETNTVVSNINYIAMGLYPLASEIEKEGFHSEIIHLGIEKYLNSKFLLSDYIKQNNIKFLAFSLHWHPQSYDVIETIKTIKEKCPDVFVMLGGFTASYFAQEILERFSFVDVVIKGEGEIPIRLLTKQVSEKNPDFSNIPNLFWRKGKEIVENKEKFVATNEDLDTFEFFDISKLKNNKSYAKVPFYLDYSNPKQLNNRPMASQGICLGRGCMGNCTWCGGGFKAMKTVTGRDFISYRSVDKAIEEIKNLKQHHEIEEFRFTFDPHPKNRSYLLELLFAIEKNFNGELKTTFTLNGLPDKEILNAFKKAFTKDSVILISPEFFNEDLRKLHKSFFYTNQELEEILEYMDEMEIRSELYFSILPTTTNEDNAGSEYYGRYLQNTFKFVTKYYVIPIIYEPAAPWTINPEKYGLDIVSKTFIDYYNDTICIENSFENTEIFLPH